MGSSHKKRQFSISAIVYGKLKYKAAISVKSSIFSSYLSDISTSVFVDYEIGASYDSLINFIKSKAGVMIPATHTFLIKYVCNLMALYLNPSVKCH